MSSADPIHSKPAATVIGGRLREHSFREQLVDTLVHGLGIGAAVAGAVPLIQLAAETGQAPKLISVLTYVTGMLAMLCASAAYNMGYATRFRPILRRLDHAAIFLMIAGTYTPFLTRLPTLTLSISLTTTIWAACLVGIVTKLAWPLLFEKLSVPLYLGLGWGSLIVISPLASGLPAGSIAALVAGGVLYTIGVLFHLREHMPFQNAIWHGFVIGAAGCHYCSILTGVVLPPA